MVPCVIIYGTIPINTAPAVTDTVITNPESLPSAAGSGVPATYIK